MGRLVRRSNMSSMLRVEALFRWEKLGRSSSGMMAPEAASVGSLVGSKESRLLVDVTISSLRLRDRR